MVDQLGSEVARGQLEALLALQDLDVRLQQLRHQRANLAERQALARADEALARLQAEREVLDQDHGRLAAERDVLDSEASALSDRILAIEDRLRSGATGSYRDQEAMSAEIASLARHRSEIEDRELSVMEQLEPLEAARAELAARHAALEADRQAGLDAYRLAAAAADDELAAAAAGRPALVDAVEPALLDTYLKLAGRLEGVAVARVLHGTCGGCRLSLSATELDRLRHDTAHLVYCEQCGRILVV